MSFITSPLPKSVEVSGRDFLVNTDFKVMLRIIELINSDKPEEEIGSGALNMFYQSVPNEHGEAAEKLLWFYRCGKELPKSSGTGARIQPVFSYEHDAGLIFAAFSQQYGIDLIECDMHWWKFKALFDGLSEKTLFSEVKRCRASEITANMSAKQREYLSSMKKLYALPLSKEDEEYKNELIDALKNGGNVSEILNKCE